MGLVELEQEAFLDQVREKSREQSRQRAISRQSQSKSREGGARNGTPKIVSQTKEGLFDGRIEGPVSPW